MDCFYEGANMLVIHPDECIDCGVCEPECPPEAILPDTADGAEQWVDFNHKYSELWPNITRKKPAIDGAEERHYSEGKMDQFDPNPGKGDE